MQSQSAYEFYACRHLDIEWDALDDWTQQQLRDVVSACSQRGWSLLKVSAAQSRILPPVLAVWHVTFQDSEVKCGWVITGDLPVDVLVKPQVTHARDALCAFSRQYLHKAHQLRANQMKDEIDLDQLKEQQRMEKWVRSAADLLVLHHEQCLWEEA
ncbi:DUF4826 family protein [Pleionea sp. CnH1-48]|uniref:DUF4826 family protein n=1 Tax=Pleionea sp. CnH1-48 TaxID=2954494 RepID=UPI002097DCF7|nr:DUF4826 family protein [Pleionea sp. CnH1-48]MCO7226014.1 DUF4826 family protein [Pleionea sp. CnH1-48]